jgi:hypothetical protein
VHQGAITNAIMQVAYKQKFTFTVLKAGNPKIKELADLISG